MVPRHCGRNTAPSAHPATGGNLVPVERWLARTSFRWGWIRRDGDYGRWRCAVAPRSPRGVGLLRSRGVSGRPLDAVALEPGQDLVLPPPVRRAGQHQGGGEARFMDPRVRRCAAASERPAQVVDREQLWSARHGSAGHPLGRRHDATPISGGMARPGPSRQALLRPGRYLLGLPLGGRIRTPVEPSKVIGRATSCRDPGQPVVTRDTGWHGLISADTRQAQVLTCANVAKDGCDLRVLRGAPGRSRTCDLSLRRRLLYPLSYWGRDVETSAHILSRSAGTSPGCPAGSDVAVLRSEVEVTDR